MAKKSSKRNPFGMNDIRESYDKVPQPKGRFRDLFQEMRERNQPNDNKPSDSRDASTK